jgi:predicted nuclease of predicted toxin-antitoxin system
LKLLVDENLPPPLVHQLADLFPNSVHVSAAGLGSTPDADIWQFAEAHGFTFLTKDKDFANLSMVRGAPPKVVLLQTGNCSTADLIAILRNNAIRILEFQNHARRSLLVLR